jgi:hypothetical protein
VLIMGDHLGAPVPYVFWFTLWSLKGLVLSLHHGWPFESTSSLCILVYSMPLKGMVLSLHILPVPHSPLAQTDLQCNPAPSDFPKEKLTYPQKFSHSAHIDPAGGGQYVPLKCWHYCTQPHDITTQEQN